MWQGIRYKILRAGSNAYEPKVLYTGKSGIYLGDDLFKLKTTADTVSLSFVGQQSLDLGILLRIHLLNFRISGDAVTRIKPLALHPEDYLDEWLHVPWSESAKSVEPGQENEAHSWHEWMKQEALEFPSLRFVQPCGDNKPAQQWALGVDLPIETKTGAKSLYFEISKTNGTFRVQTISEVRPSGCPGGSPPDSHPDLTLP
jgi:hypothetical protein